jgi:hypothetical protein
LWISHCKSFSWAPVAHAYNPSYSGGRDQEDCGSKPGQIVHENLSQKKKKKSKKPSHTKIGLEELLKV